ncbi:hypothetical protein BGW38_008859 [Lunasporangiospora selenospora]|uniref:Galactose oxidase n=1 Tax=Lunasporangiospora selenospora TaxID=979761 RepID=A0A9P6KFI7_9FUNG|nr:hypothetical protein BGW38_008859 [Lunasporangiospora selenospora]
MKVATVLPLMALAASAAAQTLVGTVGHTAAFVGNTIFIQGGQSAENVPRNTAYAIILGSGSGPGLNISRVLDHTAFSKFSTRDFGISVEGGGSLINCGTLHGGSTKMTCDKFNPTTYTVAPLDGIKDSVRNRGAMALSVADDRAYLIGGAFGSDNSSGLSIASDILMLTTALTWRNDQNVSTGLQYHTATYVDSIKGTVVLGGLMNTGGAQSMGIALVLTNGNWTQRNIGGDVPLGRYGHTTVNNGKGVLYMYGGKASLTAAPLNDMYSLNTSEPAWVWKKHPVSGIDARAFHASVLVANSLILHIFGQGGADFNSNLNTIASYNFTSESWAILTNLPTIEVANKSPNEPPKNSNNPNDPNYRHPNGDGTITEGNGGNGSGSKSNVGAIAGASVAAVVVLALGVFLFYRRRIRRQGTAPVKRNQNNTGSTAALGGPDETDKTKLARSFTIRAPTNNYVEDDRDLDQTHHPRYKSDVDARGNPYYGDGNGQSLGRSNSKNASVVEYELSDTSSQTYGGGNGNGANLADRKRYVEQQQRKVMDEYEMAYPHHDLQGASDAGYYNDSQRGGARLGGRTPSSGGHGRSRSQGKNDYMF